MIKTNANENANLPLFWRSFEKFLILREIVWENVLYVDYRFDMQMKLQTQMSFKIILRLISNVSVTS